MTGREGAAEGEGNIYVCIRGLTSIAAYNVTIHIRGLKTAAYNVIIYIRGLKTEETQSRVLSISSRLHI
jgi:hypothetical protein